MAGTRHNSLGALGPTLKSGYHHLRSKRDPGWAGYGEPFNGQAGRQETIRQLLTGFEPDSCIETGTFYGFTTRRLADLGLPVFTIEVNPGFLNIARLRLARARNVTFLEGNSGEVMRALAGRPEIRRPFVYLDAHWGDHLPLPDEVSAVFDAWSDALVAVDDFLVPGDPDYGYDVYHGDPLALDLLPLPSDAVAAYPALPARYETGARRGTLYLGRGQRSIATMRDLIDAGTLRQADRAASGGA